MKKFFLLLSAVFALSIVGCTQRVRIESSDDSTQTVRHKVGDIIQIGDELGIVFAISSDGMHGKAMSLSQTQCDWWDAIDWCWNLGGDWRLPTRSELLMISENRKRIDRRLKSNGATRCKDYVYWSSEELSEDEARRVSMDDGHTYRSRKYNSYYVRAVSAF